MLQIKDKQHISTIIESLFRTYKRAKINGVLKVNEIYYLNIIKKLLNNDNLVLTNDENNLLINIYNKLSFNSDQICPPKIYKSYQTTPIVKFEQAEVEDCNNIVQNKSILYWQEIYTLNNSEITELVDSTGYLVDKLSDTYENFELGKDIDYTKFGKIVFLALESDTTNYTIRDSQNNNVTHTFEITLVPELNATLIISDNTYSHGTMNFKIIKQ
jgi:hypothetical protein